MTTISFNKRELMIIFYMTGGELINKPTGFQKKNHTNT